MQHIYEVTFKVTRAKWFGNTDLGYETVKVEIPEQINFPENVVQSKVRGKAERKLYQEKYSLKHYPQPERFDFHVISVKKIK